MLFNEWDDPVLRALQMQVKIVKDNANRITDDLQHPALIANNMACPVKSCPA
jgi:hypothetical protein